MDLFGHRKMYKKGIADALKANEGFAKKQQDAIAHLNDKLSSVTQKLDNAIESVEHGVNGIYEYLDSQEKAALYQLTTPTDIKELEEADKRLLLAALYQLAENEGDALTDNQRSYIRSIQKYLEITNPQTFADLSAIENIDSIDVQKAFLRVVLEFLYLQDGDEMSGDQAEVLDYFGVNKKQAAAIENEVSQLFKIVGPAGIAEKYGYVPEDTGDAVESNNTGISLASQGCGNYEIDDSDVREFIGNLQLFHGSKIVETENYVLLSEPSCRKKTLRCFDKRTKVMDEYPASYSYIISSFFDFSGGGTRFHFKIFGDKIMWHEYDGNNLEENLYLLDVSTLPQPPVQIFSYNEGKAGHINDFSEKIYAFYDDTERKLLYYDISEDELWEVSLDKDMKFGGNCFQVVGDKIYFTTACYDRNYWSHSLVCYDISKGIFTRIGEPPYINETDWYSFHDRMYITMGGYPAFSVGYTDLIDKNLYFHKICNNVSVGTSFYSVKDGILFVDLSVDGSAEGALQYLNFKDGTVTRLTSEKFNRYGDFFAIEDWAYYKTRSGEPWKKVRLSDPADSQPVAWT